MFDCRDQGIGHCQVLVGEGGDAGTITVPSLDVGRSSLNQKLEEADLLLKCASARRIWRPITAPTSTSLTVRGFMRLERDAAIEIRAFDQPIPALARMTGWRPRRLHWTDARPPRPMRTLGIEAAKATFASGLSAVNALAVAPRWHADRD